MARRRRSVRRKRGRKSKGKATRRARIVLTKVGYAPAESKMLDEDFTIFDDQTSTANSKDPDIAVKILNITDAIAKGTSDQQRIGNTIYVKAVSWNYSFKSNSAYRTSADSQQIPKFPHIHVFLVSLKCSDPASWWIKVQNGLGIKPDSFDTMYKKLRSQCNRIIRHWRIGGGTKFQIDATSRQTIAGRIRHKFNTPIRIQYKEEASSIMQDGNQLVYIVYLLNDGDPTPIDSWALTTDGGAGYHNMQRIQFMG